MKITCSQTYRYIPRQLLRKCRYHEFVDPRTQKISYVRTLRAGVFYPRFHVYIKTLDEGFIIDLHLDQKKPTYKGSHAHNAEYDGAVVESEAQRISQIIAQYSVNT